MNSSISRNIPILFFFKISRWLLLFMPTIILFFNEFGLDMMEIMLLQSVFGISLAIFEIPSGYFSDIIGRKKTLIISAFGSIIGFSLFAIGTNFWYLLVAELSLAIGASMNSGTDSALLYESLLSLKREDEYLQLEGKIGASGNFAEGAAAIIGTYIAMFNIHYPYYAQVLLNVFGLIAILFLIEPKAVQQKSSENKIKQLKSVINNAVNKNKELRGIIFLSGVIGIGTLTAAWFAQEYFKVVEVPLAYYGYLWAALQFIVGFGAWFANGLTSRLNFTTVSILIILGIAVSFFSLSISMSIAALFFIFVINFLRGIAEPYFKNLINKLTDPNFRATVLSIRGLLIRFSFAILSPIIGWISDVYTLKYALFAIGLFVFVSGIIIIFQMKFISKNLNAQ